MMYEWIKDFYELGIYNNDPEDSNRYIGYFVESNDISVEQYQQITESENYIEPVA